MSVLCSVLTPTKNRPQWTALAVQQFLQQTHTPREMVIVEDGDHDLRMWLWQKLGLLKNVGAFARHTVAGTEYLRLQAAEGVTIKYVRYEGTTGAKLNKAAAVAEGEYLFRFDSDDWQHPTRLAVQLEHFRISGAAMVGLTSAVFYEEGKPHGWIWAGISSDPLGATQAYRRDWFLSNPAPDQSLSEDNASSRKAWEQETLFAVSGLHHLVVARDHDDNTGKRSEESFRENRNCEAFLKVELGAWYEQTVKPWAAAPLERTPIQRIPKNDWAKFAEQVRSKGYAV